MPRTQGIAFGKAGALVVAAVLLLAAGCASPAAAERQSTGRPGTILGRAGEGPARVISTEGVAIRSPATPALQALKGRTPLLYVARGPGSDAGPREPAYEIAVFEDGTLVYEGHRCVKLGGLVVKHLAVDELADLRALLAGSCAGVERSPDDEICLDADDVRVTCAAEGGVRSGTDHCAHGTPAAARLRQLASAAAARTGVDAWLGAAAADRQACDPAAADLAPGEISRLLAPQWIGGELSLRERGRTPGVRS